jgi:predicted dehydrogenase
LLRRNDVELVSICDVSDRMLTSAKGTITKSGKKMPEIFTGDNYAWKKMLDKHQLDGIVIATPWEWHKEMIIGALDAGVKYVGSEVMIGITLEDHWDVVKAAEKHKATCDDARKCLLPPRCNGRAEHGAPGNVWRDDPPAGWLPARSCAK